MGEIDQGRVTASAHARDLKIVDEHFEQMV